MIPENISSDNLSAIKKDIRDFNKLCDKVLNYHGENVTSYLVISTLLQNLGFDGDGCSYSYKRKL